MDLPITFSKILTFTLSLLHPHRFQPRESRYREVVDFGKITRIRVTLGGKLADFRNFGSQISHKKEIRKGDIGRYGKTFLSQREIFTSSGRSGGDP